MRVSRCIERMAFCKMLIPLQWPIQRTTPTSFVTKLKFQPQPTEPHMDRLRSPMNRFQTLMRMPNLSSDNSQVFLVRMTIGLFEVDAGTLSLGAEYNAEFGTAKRQSALFVIDRSIPVCFIPGQDTNVEDVIIYQSISE